MMKQRSVEPILRLSDEEIVQRVLKGEKHWFEQLIRKFNLRLYRIGMAIINDDQEVEDVMQTTYINAYLHLADFQQKSSFGTWLTRILINESLLFVKRRRKKNLTAIDNLEIAHHETPLNGLMNIELKTILEKSVADLPEKYRLVFVMREIEEISTSETMEVLQLSESNVKIRLNRAKEMLRNDLGKHYKSQIYDFHLSRCDRVVNFVMNQILHTPPTAC
ncbi:MAG: sigma-70 family RNA polymerase sigma factor [Bacteroidetes bacterium]|nr:sigma-70 family RNA polymerase sigma factor [Bacteroidota bacterium]